MSLLPLLILVAVSASLLVGALWGIYGRLPEKLEGFLLAMAGGALMISAVVELIQPAVEQHSMFITALLVFFGAAVFSCLDYLVDEQWNSEGGGMLVAITLDGLPENLALGVALIGAEPMAVAALAGSIVLANVPEAASSAKDMEAGEMSRGTILGLWAGTALVLALAAIAGNFFLREAPEQVLNYIKCFAGGAVVASLALEVFPRAYKKKLFGQALPRRWVCSSPFI